MDIQITGKVKQILEEVSGEGKNGPWRKQDFILETEGKYPKPVCITHWGDDIEAFAIKEGERLTAHVDIQSREYNGRWYTDVKAWRVSRDDADGQAPPAADDEPWADSPPGDWEEEGDDGLPF